MNRIPLGRFVVATSLCWAIVVLCTAGAFDFAGLMVARFFLGVAEGGISPAYVLVTGMWYKKDEIPRRTTFWFAANGLAIILQALISYGIGHIVNTGIPTWKWFFVIFGLASLVMSAILWYFMPNSPLDARFLNDEEKMIAVERLRDNRTGVANREFKKYQLIEALKDPLVYYNFFLVILIVVPNSGVSFVRSQSGSRSRLLSAADVFRDSIVRHPYHSKLRVRRVRQFPPADALWGSCLHWPTACWLHNFKASQYPLHQPGRLLLSGHHWRCPRLLSAGRKPGRPSRRILLDRLLKRCIATSVRLDEFKYGRSYEALDHQCHHVLGVFNRLHHWSTVLLEFRGSCIPDWLQNHADHLYVVDCCTDRHVCLSDSAKQEEGRGHHA